MTDNNISKTSLVHMDKDEVQDTKLVITVPPSDKEQTFELLNFTPAGCVSILNMLQHELGADPAVLNNGTVISCVTTAIFCNHPHRVGDAHLRVVHPHSFPKRPNGNGYGDTPISCNSKNSFMPSRTPNGSRKRSFAEGLDVNKKL